MYQLAMKRPIWVLSNNDKNSYYYYHYHHHHYYFGYIAEITRWQLSTLEYLRNNYLD